MSARIGQTRIFATLPDSIGEESGLCPLSRELQHHLLKVLRLRAGDLIELVCNSSQKVYLARLEYREGTASASIVELLSSQPQRPRVRSLCCAVCKGDKIDTVCEKATELGVERLLIWQGHHSQVKLAKSQDNKQERWHRIVESAARQSKKSFIPGLKCILSLEQVLGDITDFSNSDDITLWCSTSAEALELRNLKEQPAGGVHIIVGPEGDFSAEEVSLLRSFRAHEVSLGPSILRAETAAIASVAMVQALWGFSQ